MNSGFWSIWSENHVDNLARWTRLGAVIRPSGDGWKQTWTANPALLQLGDRLLLYYRGTGKAPGESEERDQIGVAEVVQIGARGIVVDEISNAPCIATGGGGA